MAFLDRREAILLRILGVLSELPGVVTVHRNRADFQAVDPETHLDILPVAVLLDGTEKVKTSGILNPNTGARGPAIMELCPQIFIVLKPTDDINNLGQGELMSLMRSRLVELITLDSALYGLMGTNGGVEYRGCMTDMQTGSSIQGQMQLEFVFAYVLDLTELVS